MSNWGAVGKLWRQRAVSGAANRAYVAYAASLVGLVVLIPFGRATWLTATSDWAYRGLTSPSAPYAVGLVVDLTLACALLLGTKQGPAVLPAFLVWATGQSDIRRCVMYRRPLGLSCIFLATLGIWGGSLMVGCLAEREGLHLQQLALVVSTTLVAGLAVFCAWLTGQVFPRAAVSGSATLAVVGVAAAMTPEAHWLLSWIGRGLSPVASGGSWSAVPVVALALMTLAAASMAGAGLERSPSENLLLHAARWEALLTHTTTMDFGAAIYAYRPNPRRWPRSRTMRRSRSITVLLVSRDWLGALRTPARLISGCLLMSAGAAAVSAGIAAADWSGPLGCAGSLLLFAGLGPVSDGLRHAAQVVSGGTRLYGITDAHLMVAHALTPVAVISITSFPVATVLATVVSAPLGSAIASVAGTATACMVARISNALKGPLPQILLMPLSTPVGDPMVLVRFAWALDGLVMSLAAGWAAGWVRQTPVPVAAILLLGAAVVAARWRRRG